MSRDTTTACRPAAPRSCATRSLPVRALLRTLAVSLFLWPGAALAEGPRTLVIGGTIAEIVVALGAGDQLVGRDSTSTFPESLKALPDIGPMVQISAEGALALAPELILADPGVGPASAVEVLKAAGVDYQVIPRVLNADGVIDRIATTAAVLGREAEGAALVGKVRAQLDEAAARVAGLTQDARIPVLAVISLQGGKIMTGGEGSTVDSLITLAGGMNAGSGIDGYKVITDEAVIAAAPEVILISADSGGPYASAEDVLAHPALAHTPAVAKGRIVAMDGLLLLGFGLRTGEAILTLNEALYGPPGPAGEP